jgi:pseudouridine synthase
MSGEPVRLQKALAAAGIASRRKAEELIAAGRVAVNGQVVTEMGTRVDPDADRIEVDGQPVRQTAELHYYLIYKPVGVLSAASDARGRPVVVDLVRSEARLYPVGRLDLESEGLQLLTDDGALAERLMHPRFGHLKEYAVLLKGQLGQQEIERLSAGIVLDGSERPATAEVRLMPPDWCWRGEPKPKGYYWVRLVLREGRKRQIRYMMQALGRPVMRLIRIRQGSLRLGELQPGQGRWLTRHEVVLLRRSVGL